MADSRTAPPCTRNFRCWIWALIARQRTTPAMNVPWPAYSGRSGHVPLLGRGSGEPLRRPVVPGPFPPAGVDDGDDDLDVVIGVARRSTASARDPRDPSPRARSWRATAEALADLDARAAGRSRRWATAVWEARTLNLHGRWRHLALGQSRHERPTWSVEAERDLRCARVRRSRPSITLHNRGMHRLLPRRPPRWRSDSTTRPADALRGVRDGTEARSSMRPVRSAARGRPRPTEAVRPLVSPDADSGSPSRPRTAPSSCSPWRSAELARGDEPGSSLARARRGLALGSGGSAATGGPLRRRAGAAAPASRVTGARRDALVRRDRGRRCAGRLGGGAVREDAPDRRGCSPARAGEPTPGGEGGTFCCGRRPPDIAVTPSWTGAGHRVAGHEALDRNQHGGVRKGVMARLPSRPGRARRPPRPPSGGTELRGARRSARGDELARVGADPRGQQPTLGLSCGGASAGGGRAGPAPATRPPRRPESWPGLLAALRASDRRLSEARDDGESTSIGLERAAGQAREVHPRRTQAGLVGVTNGTGPVRAGLDVDRLVDEVGDATFVELFEVDGRAAVGRRHRRTGSARTTWGRTADAHRGSRRPHVSFCGRPRVAGRFGARRHPTPASRQRCSAPSVRRVRTRAGRRLAGPASLHATPWGLPARPWPAYRSRSCPRRRPEAAGSF